MKWMVPRLRDRETADYADYTEQIGNPRRRVWQCQRRLQPRGGGTDLSPAPSLRGKGRAANPRRRVSYELPAVSTAGQRSLKTGIGHRRP